MSICGFKIFAAVFVAKIASHLSYDPPVPISNRNCFLVNLRDALTCQSCGERPTTRETYHRGFEYHHLVHKADGGGDEAENLVLVCHACHRRHHDREIDLTLLPIAPVPERMFCRECQATLLPRAVEMNCGWYRCDRCRTKTHLFDHFGFESTSS